MLLRPVFESAGVYLLRNPSPSSKYADSVYIGEAEELRPRLKQQLASRDFESVMCCFSRDESLTKGHVKYLEARLISIARAANSSYVENMVSPKLPKLSEADISDMEHYIEQLRLILPTVGMLTLEAPAPHAPATGAAVPPLKRYKLKSKSIAATMTEATAGYIVEAGSFASLTTSATIAEGWLNIRDKLIEAGALRREGNLMIFTEDATFSSPSAASSVVLGRQSPGPIMWIADDGRTYKEIQEGDQ